MQSRHARGPRSSKLDNRQGAGVRQVAKLPAPIDFPQRFPVPILSECAFVFPSRGSYSQQLPSPPRPSQLDRRRLIDQSSSWLKGLSLRWTKMNLPPRPRL